MLKKIENYDASTIARDKKFITEMDIINTPEILRVLSNIFNPNFEGYRKNMQKGKKILIT